MRIKKLFLSALTIGFILSGSGLQAVNAATAKEGGTCSKVGTTANAGAVNLVCTKVGSKLQWKKAAATAPACPNSGSVSRELDGTIARDGIANYSVINKTKNCEMTVFFSGTFTCSWDRGRSKREIAFTDTFILQPGKFGREVARNAMTQCQQLAQVTGVNVGFESNDSKSYTASYRKL